MSTWPLDFVTMQPEWPVVSWVFSDPPCHEARWAELKRDVAYLRLGLRKVRRHKGTQSPTPPGTYTYHTRASSLLTPMASLQVLYGQLIEKEEPRPGSQMCRPDMLVKTENGLLPHYGPPGSDPKRHW